jgi:secreted trypsin-like serine protease
VKPRSSIVRSCAPSLLGILFLGAFVATAQAQGAPSARVPDGRIWYGNAVENRADVPWIASIRVNKQHNCGASLIAPNFDAEGKVVSWGTASQSQWAVTAAHCMFTRSGRAYTIDELEVVTGTLLASKADSNEAEIQRVVAILLPDASSRTGRYDPATMQNDIALLRLGDAKRDLGQRRQAIKLPTAADVNAYYSPYVAAHVAGWGATERGAASDKLLEVRLPMVPHDVCQAKYDRHGDKLLTGMICAGFVSGEYDSCYGDSGGPLYYRPAARGIARAPEAVLLGVVSWGRDCGSNQLFGVYSSTAVFQDWIRAAIQNYRP